jgi:hypothetical protein
MRLASAYRPFYRQVYTSSCAACANLPCFKISEDWGAKAEIKGGKLDERGAIYQKNFSPNCIWRDVVVVEVRTPAEEIGAPFAPNRLVLLVVTTGDAKFV